jgi:hypothetical protein
MNQRNSIRWELDQALRQNACPICWISQKSIQRFLDGLLYENVNDPGIRRHVTAALGFCNRHAWQMRAMYGASLGIALLHRDALKQWQNQIDYVGKPDGHLDLERYRKQIAQANESSEKCLACERQADVERRYIETLLEALSDREFTEALRQSAGMCHAHFAQACHSATQVETLDALVEIQTAINRRLIAELDEFIRKNDYRFVSEGLGVEGDAWIRTIERLSGAEGALSIIPKRETKEHG